MRLHELGCCGIKEIIGSNDWSQGQFFNLISNYRGSLPCGVVLLNGVSNSEYVQRFRDYIISLKIGEVQTVKEFVNPNTSRVLILCLWYVDRSALLAWYKKEEAAHKEKIKSPDNTVTGCNCSLCTAELTRQRQAAAAQLRQVIRGVQPPAPQSAVNLVQQFPVQQVPSDPSLASSNTL